MIPPAQELHEQLAFSQQYSRKEEYGDGTGNGAANPGLYLIQI